MFLEKIIQLLRTHPSISAVALGGSRARKTNSIDSDFDIFVLIRDEEFLAFKQSFSSWIRSSLLETIIVSELDYIEMRGYKFKLVNEHAEKYDISILPICRRNEMGIKSSNILMFDNDGYYAHEISHAMDDVNEQLLILQEKQKDIKHRFFIEVIDFLDSFQKHNYWLCVKSLENIKKCLLLLTLIHRNTSPKLWMEPEKDFDKIADDLCIRKIYQIDNSFDVLFNTYCALGKLFVEISDRSTIEELNHMFDVLYQSSYEGLVGSLSYSNAENITY